MRSRIEVARMLARKAEHDLVVAEACIKQELPLDVACFHLQQASEKLLKAALSSRDRDFPSTHDLRHLLDLTIGEFPGLEDFRDPLLGFASYAVDIRYDDEIVVSREEASEGLEIAKRLRSAVHCLLPPQAQP